MKAILIWKANPGQEEEFKKRWKRYSDVMQQYPGALGTKLHQSLTDSTIFIGYASWKSLEDRDAASAKMETEHPEFVTEGIGPISTLVAKHLLMDPEIESVPQ
jgi:heme-degrading monooxygenase HmoA